MFKLGGGSVIFVPKGGGGSCVFYQPHFQMLRPTPPALYFLTSPTSRAEKKVVPKIKVVPKKIVVPKKKSRAEKKKSCQKKSRAREN